MATRLCRARGRRHFVQRAARRPRASGERRHFLPSPGARRQRLRRRGRAGHGEGTDSGPRASGERIRHHRGHPISPGPCAGPAGPHGRAGTSERSALPLPASCRGISGCHSSPALREKDAVLKAVLGSVILTRFLAFSLLLSHLLPRGPKWLICPQSFSCIFRMHVKVSRCPSSRCSEMICQTGCSQAMQGEGMLEAHLSASSTKIKPCLELPWGPEHTWMCP
uniref:uncharacterized protein LOC129121825 n=1 Tax=Agelaius phoeniceus TaxID=39638 RepID=UPI0023ECAF2E|nr:uncharacterized protein LOC129121825 [Agelaius phoeniceus]